MEAKPEKKKGFFLLRKKKSEPNLQKDGSSEKASPDISQQEAKQRVLEQIKQNKAPEQQDPRKSIDQPKPNDEKPEPVNVKPTNLNKGKEKIRNEDIQFQSLATIETSPRERKLTTSTESGGATKKGGFTEEDIRKLQRYLQDDEDDQDLQYHPPFQFDFGNNNNNSNNNNPNNNNPVFAIPSNSMVVPKPRTSSRAPSPNLTRKTNSGTPILPILNELKSGNVSPGLSRRSSSSSEADLQTRTTILDVEYEDLIEFNEFIKKQILEEQKELEYQKKMKDAEFDKVVGEELQEVAQALKSGKDDLIFEGFTKLEKFADQSLPPTKLMGVLPSVVFVLKKGNPPVQLRAIRSLRKIIGASDPLRRAFARSQGLPVILRLLEEGSKDVQETAISSLAYLVSVSTLEDFCDAGAVSMLIKLLKDSQNNSKIRGQLLATVCTTFLYSERARTEMRELHGIETLFDIIKADTDKESEEESFLREQAVNALHNLSIKAPENQAIVVTLGGFDLLASLLDGGNPKLEEEALNALGALVEDNEANQQRFQKEGFPEVLMRKIKTSKVLRVKTAATYAAAKFVFKNTKAQNRLAVLDGMDTFIENLKQVNCLPLIEASCVALRALVTKNYDLKSALTKKNPIPLIINALQAASTQKGTTKTQEEASGLLFVLLEQAEPKVYSAISSTGISLIGSLLMCPDDECKVNACKCIRILGQENTKQQANIRDLAGLQALIPLLTSSNTKVTYNALWTIQTLSENNPKLQSNFRTYGAMAPLVALTGNRHAFLRERACLCLHALVVANFKNQQALRQEGGLSPLIISIQAKETNLREAATKTLAAAVAENPRNQEMVRREGGLTRLITLLQQEDEPRIQEEACNAIYATCLDNKDNQDTVRNENGLLHFTPLLGTRVVSLQLAATKAIYALCKGNTVNQDVFLDPGMGTVDSLQEIAWSPNKPLRNEVKNALALLGQVPMPRSAQPKKPTRRASVVTTPHPTPRQPSEPVTPREISPRGVQQKAEEPPKEESVWEKDSRLFPLGLMDPDTGGLLDPYHLMGTGTIGMGVDVGLGLNSTTRLEWTNPSLFGYNGYSSRLGY